MPQTNTTTSLEEEIRASRLLTDAEKTHWLITLPSMTKPQTEKLENILTTAANLPWNRNMENYMTGIAKQGNGATVTVSTLTI